MDGLLILDLNGSLILHSNFYPHSLLLHQFIQYIQQTQFKVENQIPPLIYFNPIKQQQQVSSPSSSISSSSSSSSSTNQQEHATHSEQISSVSCNLIHHQLWFAVIASIDFEPSIAFEYLNRFKDLLFNTYLKQQTASNNLIDRHLIHSHFDLVHQLIHLTAPTSQEIPFGKNWTRFELIHQLIPNKLDRSIVNFISDSTQYTFKNEKNRYNKPSIFSSPIPWRPIGLEYAKEEIRVDLVESVSVILDPSGEILKFEVVGFVDFQSKLNGLPDLLLKLNDPSKITNVGFHHCVRQGIWMNTGNVSFIPPDGTFRLMSYRRNMIDDTTKTSKSYSKGSASSLLSIPIRIEPKVTVGKKGGSFQFIIRSHQVSLSKLIIRWKLGKFATGILPDHLVCKTPDGRESQIISSSWDQDLNEISWCFKTDHPIHCCLSGLWSHKSADNQPDHSISVEFESKIEHPNMSFIGLKIETVEVKHDFDHSRQVNNQIGLSSARPSPIHKGIKMKFNSGVYQVRWD